MIGINDYIEDFSSTFKVLGDSQPWEITNDLKNIIESLIPTLNEDFIITDSAAIHKSVIIEKGVTIKKPAIISAHCYVGAHAYFREGFYLDTNAWIGPGCEIKNSIIVANTAIAHFNYIGNSIIGKNVNFEAGSIAANHYNEREDKKISVLHDSQIIETHSGKFGSLVGDHSKIGVNAVLVGGSSLITMEGKIYIED
jgi:NDP-sugar pyrophosphorylase family protein